MRCVYAEAMPDDPNRPPKHAIPLARALRELHGDWWLGALMWIARWLTPLPLEMLPSTSSHVQRIRRFEAIAAEKTLARLRRGELRSWGEPDAIGERYRYLKARVWDRVQVLDPELGEIGQVLPTGARTPVFYNVVVAKRRWGAAKRRRGAPGYKEADEPLVDKMHVMIMADPKLTPMAAAWRVAPLAKSGGAPLFKARRLRDLYGEKFET